MALIDALRRHGTQDLTAVVVEPPAVEAENDEEQLLLAF
jgi:hypothetical protein